MARVKRRRREDDEALRVFDGVFRAHVDKSHGYREELRRFDAETPDAFDSTDELLPWTTSIPPSPVR